jgi:glycosyltransferase involved in cell wall biosynthesis
MADAESGRPRILVVTKKLALGGAERHLAGTLPDIRSRGLAIELFVLERGGELEEGLTARGVPISGAFRSLGRVPHLLVAAAALYRRIRTMRPDIVHFFLPEPYVLGALVAMIARQNICIMSRRSLANYQRKHPLLARIEHLLHRRMAALVGNSQAVVEELAGETRDRGKIGLIHNGLVLDGLAANAPGEAQRTALNIPLDAFVMVIVANLFPYKGHSDLLNALGDVASRLPQPWRLLIVGRDEGEGPHLKLQAAQLGIADRILWLGERRDVEAIFAAADLGLLVSHEEGFSNALIEAMAHGLPMIASAVGGNLDAIVDGRSGRLVPVGNTARLGEAILELAENPSTRKALGLAARERATAMFSQAGCVDRYVRLYRGIGHSPEYPVQAIIDGALPAVKAPH